MAQDNVLKRPTQMGVPENASGEQSGVSPEGEWGATATQNGRVSNVPDYINISASTENRSAKFKNPQNKQDAPMVEQPISY